MARQWFRPLLMLGVLPSFPLMLVLFILFYKQPWWAALVLWWLKPLWETLQLHFIADALFNPQLQWRSVMARSRKLLFHQFFAKLLLQRWSLSRSFNMPVSELEHLTGHARRKRLTTLHRDANSTSVWLTLFGNTVEGLLVIALFAALWMLVPMKLEVDYTMSDLVDSPLLFPALAWVAYLAMALVSPFYVCCGFMLYINRRTWLEAWDIELSFRQLAAKSRKNTQHTGAILIFLALPLLAIAPADKLRADTAFTPEASQQQITEILESDDFNQMQDKTGLRWVESNRQNELQEDPHPAWLTRQLERLDKWIKQSPFMNGILNVLSTVPNLLEAVLWGTVIASVVFLIYRFRHTIMPGWLGQAPEKKAQRPTHLFGLELDQLSLPEDVLAQSRHLWHQQKQREALSLLYRAALSHLIHEDQVLLKDSHTEAECVALCRRQVITSRSDFFQNLTQHWITLAYAHQLPDDRGFETLCAGWPTFYSEKAAR